MHPGPIGKERKESLGCYQRTVPVADKAILLIRNPKAFLDSLERSLGTVSLGHKLLNKLHQFGGAVVHFVSFLASPSPFLSL